MFCLLVIVEGCFVVVQGVVDFFWVVVENWESVFGQVEFVFGVEFVVVICLVGVSLFVLGIQVFKRNYLYFFMIVYVFSFKGFVIFFISDFGFVVGYGYCFLVFCCVRCVLIFGNWLLIVGKWWLLIVRKW